MGKIRKKSECPNRVANAALKFFEVLKGDRYGRYRSWEHCYRVFRDARINRQNGEPLDYDCLSLHLAFYLASWGMYRGSSFLLQQDYKVHGGAVREIMRSKYDLLQGIKCEELENSQARKCLWSLRDKLKDLYEGIRSKVAIQCKKAKPRKDASDILISKILMGTLGCVPAYDRYFVSGVRAVDDLVGSFSDKSILKLIEFYDRNNSSLEKARKEMCKYSHLDYPQMKVLDMGFWKIGADNDK